MEYVKLKTHHDSVTHNASSPSCTVVLWGEGTFLYYHGLKSLKQIG